MADNKPLITFTQKTKDGPAVFEFFQTYMVSHDPPGTGGGVGSDIDVSYVVPYRSIKHFEHLRGGKNPETADILIYCADMELHLRGSEESMAKLSQRLAGLLA